MGKLFVSKQAGLPPRLQRESQYFSARFTLFIVVALTLINVIMALIHSDSYFLFSLFVPYLLIAVSMELCGLLPAEYYDEFYEGGYAAQEFFSPSLFYVALAIALVMLAVYAALAFLSRKQKGGFLIAALVLFVLDSAVMLAIGGIDPEMLVNYFICAWVIIYLARGVVAWGKLKTMPPEEMEILEPEGEAAPGFGKTHEYTGLFKEIWEAYEQGTMKERLAEAGELISLDGKSNIDALDIVIRRNEQDIAFGIDEESVTMFVSHGSNSKNEMKTIPLSDLYDIEDLYTGMISYIWHNS